MARPGDQMAAGAGGHSLLRAGARDREQVIAALKAAFVQGRLDRDEFDLRVSQVLASQTYADLAVVTADISAGLTQAQPPEPARESNAKKAVDPGRRIEVVVALAIVAASIVTAVVIHKQNYCIYHGPPGVPNPPCPGYPMAFRLGIVAAGFIVAGLIVAIGGYAHRRRG